MAIHEMSNINRIERTLYDSVQSVIDEDRFLDMTVFQVVGCLEDIKLRLLESDDED